MRPIDSSCAPKRVLDHHSEFSYIDLKKKKCVPKSDFHDAVIGFDVKKIDFSGQADSQTTE